MHRPPRLSLLVLQCRTPRSAERTSACRRCPRHPRACARAASTASSASTVSTRVTPPASSPLSGTQSAVVGYSTVSVRPRPPELREGYAESSAALRLGSHLASAHRYALRVRTRASYYVSSRVACGYCATVVELRVPSMNA